MRGRGAPADDRRTRRRARDRPGAGHSLSTRPRAGAVPGTARQTPLLPVAEAGVLVARMHTSRRTHLFRVSGTRRWEERDRDLGRSAVLCGAFETGKLVPHLLDRCRRPFQLELLDGGVATRNGIPVVTENAMHLGEVEKRLSSMHR